LALYEARYNPDNSPKNGTYRLGVWYNSELFADQAVDTLGVSLASPLSNGMPRQHRGNASIYGIVLTLREMEIGRLPASLGTLVLLCNPVVFMLSHS
jgi:hypothetical protein